MKCMEYKRETKESGLVTLKREGYVDQGYTGEAYAFFDSPVPIEDEDLRPESSDLVLRLARGEENFLNGINASEDFREIVVDKGAQLFYLEGDPKSMEERLEESVRVGNKPFDYGLHAVYGDSNVDAANQLVQVMRYVHRISGKELFRSTILYQNDDGEYVSRG